MKKFLIVITALMISNFIIAQSLTFKFANPKVIQGAPDIFQFDVEVKASTAGTFHRDLQIYFDYNTAAFGSNIVTNSKITVTNLDLMDNHYIVVNSADNTSSKFAVITEGSNEMTQSASATYFNEVSTSYQGVLRFTIEIADNTELTGIAFDEALMDGGQYYQSPSPDVLPLKYGDPSAYANDLLTQTLTSEFQTLSGSENWNIWSTYINPEDPAIDQMFASIQSGLDIVKDGDGNAWFPGIFNGIGDHTIGEGYKVKVKTGTGGVTVDVTGGKLVPEITPFDIPLGWSIMGYLRDNPGDVTVMLASIEPSVVIVKDENGFAWFPGIFNGIGNMNPGKGYKINLAVAESDFAYPSNSKGMIVSGITPKTAKYFNDYTASEYNHSLLIPASAWDVMPQDDDEIGVFDIDNNLVGAGVVLDGYAQAAIWGDDSFTEGIQENMQNGQAFSIKLYRQNENIEQLVSVIDWAQGGYTYFNDGISIAKSVETSTLGSDDMFAQNGDKPVLYQNVPNPFKDKTCISFYVPNEMKVEIYLYSIHGNLIDVLTSQTYKRGTHNLKLNSREFNTGNYLYKMVTGQFTDTKYMIVK